MTRVRSSGVWIPGIGFNGPGFFGAPTMSAKYVVYSLLTLEVNARSKAYLTSREVTSRLTGGEKRTPLRSLTVIVLASAETSGGPAARSGTSCVEPGLTLYRGRCVA